MFLSRHTLTKIQPAATRIVARSLASDVQGKLMTCRRQRGIYSDGSTSDSYNYWSKAFAGFLAAAAAGVATVEATSTTPGTDRGVTLMEPAKATAPSRSMLRPYNRDAPKEYDPNNPPKRPDLPTIPLDEVAEHCDEDSLWYCFRGAVYDLTFFINGHPGGTPVSLACCRSKEPFVAHLLAFSETQLQIVYALRSVF